MFHWPRREAIGPTDRGTQSSSRCAPECADSYRPRRPGEAAGPGSRQFIFPGTLRFLPY